MQAFIEGLVTTVLIPALIGIIGYAVHQAQAAFTKKTGIEIDAVVSLQMHAAIERYIKVAFAKSGYDPETSERDPLLVTNVIRGAQEYVEQMNPDAFERFGYDKVREAVKKHAGEV